MIKGFYAAASAMVAGMKRQNALSHNIANLETPGFRQILLAMDDWYVTPVKSASEAVYPHLDVNSIRKPGYVGLGTETSEEINDFSQGTLKATGEELDLAVRGTGFFRVKTPDGERYTRDGRFHKDKNGNLVTVDGYQVLNTGGQAITLPDAPVRVDENGVIYNAISGANVGQIGVAAFDDPQAELVRDGTNTFVAEGGITGENPGVVEQGYLEMANANVDSLMTQMVIVGRAYEAAQRVVQMQDETTGKLISNLNRP